MRASHFSESVSPDGFRSFIGVFLPSKLCPVEIGQPVWLQPLLAHEMRRRCSFGMPRLLSFAENARLQGLLRLRRGPRLSLVRAAAAESSWACRRVPISLLNAERRHDVPLIAKEGLFHFLCEVRAFYAPASCWYQCTPSDASRGTSRE